MIERHPTLLYLYQYPVCGMRERGHPNTVRHTVCVSMGGPWLYDRRPKRAKATAANPTDMIIMMGLVFGSQKTRSYFGFGQIVPDGTGVRGRSARIV